MKNQSSLVEVVQKKSRTNELELLVACFIAKHNLAFNLAADLCTLLKRVGIKDAEVQNMACGRYKATMIIKNVIGKEQMECIVKRLQENVFSLIVDESTDVGNLKQLALVVRIFDKAEFKPIDIFLALIEVTDATAENLFKVIVQLFEKHSIDYKKI